MYLFICFIFPCVSYLVYYAAHYAHIYDIPFSKHAFAEDHKMLLKARQSKFSFFGFLHKRLMKHDLIFTKVTNLNKHNISKLIKHKQS